MIALLAAALRLAVPLAFAGVGETVSQRAGMLNVSLEGMILSGALAGVIGSGTTGSALIGVLAAMGAGLLVAALQGVLTIRFRANQIVIGLAINIFALGMTSFLYRVAYQSRTQTVPGLDIVRIPGLDRLPGLGTLLFQQRVLFFVLIGITVITWYLLWRTVWGLEVRAAGDDPDSADAVGVPVERRRMQAVLFCGALAGIAGAYLSIGELRNFSEAMSGGRGYIVIAAVILGRWTLKGTVGACALFGLAEALRFELPARGYSLPTEFLLGFPYLIALLALVFSGSLGGRAPAALLRPFTRGARGVVAGG